MGAGENRFAPELNEKEVIELLGNATPGSIKEATNKQQFWCPTKSPCEFNNIIPKVNFLCNFPM